MNSSDNRPDVICIGAINYDYMFQCKDPELIIMDKDEGNEDLDNAISEVEKDISELISKNVDYTTQIGGSAFITLKVIKSILPDQKVAYVGVCGTPNQFDHRYGKSNNVKAELKHLDNREWLFTTEDRYDEAYLTTIAKSVVRLYNHSRNCIKIAACANDTLLGRIQEKEDITGASFAEYLSGAKWIHLSSLADFDQFEVIMGYVAEAKKMNPKVHVSMDPGFEYTSLRRARLQKLMAPVDYLFLNKSEKKNLGKNEKRARALYQELREYFAALEDKPERVLIVKYDDRHELISFVDGHYQIRTVRHQKLYRYQMNNDTGAGDSFAGGFVAGMLCEDEMDPIAFAIQVGVVAARGKMISFDYEDPYENIANMTKKIVSK